MTVTFTILSILAIWSAASFVLGVIVGKVMAANERS